MVFQSILVCGTLMCIVLGALKIKQIHDRRHRRQKSTIIVPTTVRTAVASPTSPESDFGPPLDRVDGGIACGQDILAVAHSYPKIGARSVHQVPRHGLRLESLGLLGFRSDASEPRLLMCASSSSSSSSSPTSKYYWVRLSDLGMESASKARLSELKLHDNVIWFKGSPRQCTFQDAQAVFKRWVQSR